MAVVFARSFTDADIVVEPAEVFQYSLTEDARVTAGEYASWLIGMFEDSMEGHAKPDLVAGTEMDGTYDLFGDKIVHWRDDGFIDLAVYDNTWEPKSIVEKIILEAGA